MINKFSRLADEVISSGLFDSEWYATRFDDVALVSLDPVEHFVRFGLLLNRDPGPEFDTQYYSEANPDVVAAGIAPLLHFIRHGEREGRQPLPVTKSSVQMAEAAEVARQVSSRGPEFCETRYATDMFGLRGLQPRSELAVILNVDKAEDIASVMPALSVLEGNFDFFVLAVADLWEGEIFPANISSVTWLGYADQAGQAEGFVRLAASGALDDYRSVLWLSPKDDVPQASAKQIAQIIGLQKDFTSDAQWGIAGSDLVQLPYSECQEICGLTNDNALLRLNPNSLEIADGAGIWFKPLLARSLAAEWRIGGKLEVGFNRRAALVLLAASANDGDLDVRSAAKVTYVAEERAKRSCKAVAYYLQQSHPIAENDKWWGRGFTEWFNVVRGKPFFRGHYQPRLPADLGYYDLRLEEIQVQQADLAEKFGIHGFCFYYYWFNGKKLLNKPIEKFFASTHIDAGFCVCWANENWSRNWDGQNKEVLIKQE